MVLRYEIEKLELKPGDILLVKAAGSHTPESLADVTLAMRAKFEQRGMDNLIVVVNREEFNIRVVDEAEMNQYGWFKLEAAAEVVEEEPHDDGDDPAGSSTGRPHRNARKS